MYWSEAAVRRRFMAAARGVESNVEYVDAYRCANGHTSQECPLCHSYDTAAWGDSDHPPHYHVICGACGNDSIVEK
jgi:hypothetical protein